MRGVLCVAAGPPESASWAVFPAAVHRLLRGSVVGAGDCVAGRGFSEPAGFPGPGRDRGAAEPLDAVAHAASRAPERALGASDGLLGLPMDASGSGRLNRSSPSCLNRSAQRIDFFHGLLGVRAACFVFQCYKLFPMGHSGRAFVSSSARQSGRNRHDQHAIDPVNHPRVGHRRRRARTRLGVRSGHLYQRHGPGCDGPHPARRDGRGAGRVGGR